MTVLVAQNKDGVLTLASDSMASRGQNGSQFDLLKHKGQKKIVEINDLVFSSAGRFEEAQKFKLYCSSHKPESESSVGVQRFFVGFHRHLTDFDSDDKIGNAYFLIFKGKLFYFQEWSVVEILSGDYMTDGSGYAEAYMAMYLGKSCKESIELTIELHSWAGGSVQIVERTASQ